MTQSLELLPPTKKYECDECHKKFSHITKCRDKKNRCKVCMRWKPTNKFYIPDEKRREQYNRITKFTLTEWEKDKLHDQFVSQGLSSYDAWKRVKSHCYLLRSIGRNKRRHDTYWRNQKVKEEQNQIESKKETKKEFIRGLQ